MPPASHDPGDDRAPDPITPHRFAPDSFALDPRLAADCHVLGQLELSLVLLMDNAVVPWFVLVPRTTEVELYRLGSDERQALDGEVDALSRHLVEQHAVDKLNVAAIGNVVRQLHVHVIGRRRDDPEWPNVMWGTSHRRPYASDQVDELKAALARDLGGRLRPTPPRVG